MDQQRNAERGERHGARPVCGRGHPAGVVAIERCAGRKAKHNPWKALRNRNARHQ